MTTTSRRAMMAGAAAATLFPMIAEATAKAYSGPLVSPAATDTDGGILQPANPAAALSRR